MFRESSSIDSERTAASVRSLYAKYSAAEDSWFDGTPDSVDRRILQAKKIANISKQASVRLSGRNSASQYIALAAEMDSDRKSLEGLRRDLLTAAMDLEDDEPVYEMHERDPHTNPDGHHTSLEDLPPDVQQQLLHWQWEKEHRDFYGSRSAARHFIAEQECDDLRELTIRAVRHAERLSSTLPMDESRVFVSSFVEAVRDAYEPPKSRRTASFNPVPDFPADFLYMD